MTVAETRQRPPAAGEQAPELDLPSTSGANVSLADFRGRRNVLLAFFPLAFTSVCTAELCAFSEDYDALAATGTVVLPVSVDSVPTLKEFRAKHAMRVHLLSDFKREASRAYGVLRDDTFCSDRAYFLVDRNGVLRWTHVEETPGARRENTELLERIAALG